MDMIISTSITAAAAIIGAILGYIGKRKVDAIKEAQREQVQNDKMDRILDEQREMRAQLKEHNGYAEKFSVYSKDLAILNEKLTYTNKAIDLMQKDIEILKSKRCTV